MYNITGLIRKFEFCNLLDLGANSDLISKESINTKKQKQYGIGGEHLSN